MPATNTALTVADLIAMNEMTRTRAAMIAAGLEFFAEETGGGVYYTGTVSDDAWAAIDAVAREEAAERAQALKAARDRIRGGFGR